MKLRCFDASLFFLSRVLLFWGDASSALELLDHPPGHFSNIVVSIFQCLELIIRRLPALAYSDNYMMSDLAVFSWSSGHFQALRMGGRKEWLAASGLIDDPFSSYFMVARSDRQMNALQYHNTTRQPRRYIT